MTSLHLFLLILLMCVAHFWMFLPQLSHMAPLMPVYVCFSRVFFPGRLYRNLAPD